VPAGWNEAGRTGLTTWTFTVPVTSAGAVDPTPHTPPLPAGTDYQFTATFNPSDNNFLQPTSTDEPLNINRGNPTTATTIMAAPGSSLTGTGSLPIGALGTSVFDTATVTGNAAFPPTGMVTFTFTGPQLANLNPPPGSGWT